MTETKLQQYLNRRISECRKREKHTRRHGYDVEAPGPQYWEGNVNALVNFRRWLNRKR